MAQNDIQGASVNYIPITFDLMYTLSTKLPQLLSLELSNCSLDFNELQNHTLFLANWRFLDTLAINQIMPMGEETGMYCIILLYVFLELPDVCYKIERESTEVKATLIPSTTTEDFCQSVLLTPSTTVITISLNHQIRNVSLIDGNTTIRL